MAFVPAENCALAEVRYLWQGQRVENTIWVEALSPLNVAVLGDIGIAIRDWHDLSLRPLQSTTLVLQEIYLTDQTTSTGASATIAADPLTAAGQVSGDCLPNNNSLAVSFRTNGRGRSSRGRNFILGLAESQTVASTVNSAVAADYVEAYAELQTALLGLDCNHVVVSRRLNNADRVTALVQPISAYLVVDLTVDSQRRRLPGRGR